jgi:hypothetical protein
MKQQQKPSLPVLIEPDSDVEEPPRKRFKSAPSPQLSTPKTTRSLLEARKVLRNSSSCRSPDDANLLLIDITRRIGTRSNQRLDTSRIYTTAFISKTLPGNDDVVITALSPVPAPPKIPKLLLLPLGRPLGGPPRLLLRGFPGDSVKRRNVVQR